MNLLELQVTGAVQGVGFRPFVYRLAHELSLGGWVRNDARGVLIRVVGPEAMLNTFMDRLKSEAPAAARIEKVAVLLRAETTHTEPFRILASEEGAAGDAGVMADLATCPDCLREMLDPANRRYRYPFTNCTHCGPRFSIIQGIPYDRARTTMRAFVMCPDCRAEYENPADRRFHAQPNACPVCGPKLAWWDSSGQTLADGDTALTAAADALRSGHIVAVKGLGGFHLMCDARRDDVVRELRKRKHREEKPFAVMLPGLPAVCDADAALLNSRAAPIVLIARWPGCEVAEAVAPGNPSLGVMLPYTPMHHLLLLELGFPLVATSGNVSDEPICTDEREAVARLRGLADFFLVHDRPIARPLDDSVVRIIGDKPCVLRRARGYAPLPIPLVRPVANPILAVGAHMKTSVTLLVGSQAVVGPHVGDLDSLEARQAFTRAAHDLPALYAADPARWVCDRHPDYASSVFAREHGCNLVTVQHHHAHIASGMAEHGLEGPVLGLAWDGTGLGDDGTIWGGEFLRVERGSCTRVGTFRTFPLPGGDHAARKPVWSAVGLLHEYFPQDMPDIAAHLLGLPAAEISALLSVMNKAPRTSSVGRLFDAVAALTGICRSSSFEGQAAMMLEWRIRRSAESYGFALTRKQDLGVVDWGEALRGIVEEVGRGVEAEVISARFHRTLAEVAVAVAKEQPERRVMLSGGCFQNRYLTELCIQRLREEGFTPYWQHLVPPNDGGISLGQAWVASYVD